MTKELVTKVAQEALERVLIHGDLAGLTEIQRVQYVNTVCKILRISPMLRPFDFIKLNGRIVMYPNRACAEQLRTRDKISIQIIARERIDNLYVVTGRGKSLKTKREDEALGAVNIKGLAGEALANALMKAETKMKRRLTLSLAGLGMLDEVEVRDVVDRESREATEVAVDESTQKLAQTTERPEFENEAQVPSLENGPHEPESSYQTEYKLKSMRGAKGKALGSVPVRKLADWLKYYDKSLAEGAPLSPEVQDDAFHIRPFLEENSPEVFGE